MPRFDFWKRTYGEDTVLERAKKRAKDDDALQRVIESVYFHPQASDAEIANASAYGIDGVDEESVRLRYRPQALRMIEQERARNTPVPDTSVSNAPMRTIVTELASNSIDDMEADAIAVVNKANSGVGAQHALNKVIIFLFKTFAPLTVLALTIPESIYVFSHIYTHPDDTLRILTGIFAVLVDFGYLYLTVLLAMNKEAMFKRQRAGMDIEPHERKAIRVQSVLWWVVALMDMLAQAVFLYGATQDSIFFDHRLVLSLVVVRIVSLFLTMFVVSFAGTELMTSIDKITNEQIERANNIGKVLTATGEARLRKQDARQKLERAIRLQDLQREGDILLGEIYADARNNVRQQRLLKGPDTTPKSIK